MSVNTKIAFCRH